jgi:transposase
MPAQYVKPYVKTNKSDYIDAEAIAEAVGRPNYKERMALAIRIIVMGANEVET